MTAYLACVSWKYLTYLSIYYCLLLKWMSSCQWTRHYIQLEGLQNFISQKEPLWCLYITSILAYPFFRSVKLLGNPFYWTKMSPWTKVNQLSFLYHFFQGVVPQRLFMPLWMFHFYVSFNVTLAASVVLFVSKKTILGENVFRKFTYNRQIS